jgi:hypothetical protein
MHESANHTRTGGRTVGHQNDDPWDASPRSSSTPPHFAGSVISKKRSRMIDYPVDLGLESGTILDAALAAASTNQ